MGIGKHRPQNNIMTDINTQDIESQMLTISFLLCGSVFCFVLQVVFAGDTGFSAKLNGG